MYYRVFTTACITIYEWLKNLNFYDVIILLYALVASCHRQSKALVTVCCSKTIISLMTSYFFESTVYYMKHSSKLLHIIQHMHTFTLFQCRSHSILINPRIKPCIPCQNLWNSEQQPPQFLTTYSRHYNRVLLDYHFCI